MPEEREDYQATPEEGRETPEETGTAPTDEGSGAVEEELPFEPDPVEEDTVFSDTEDPGVLLVIDNWKATVTDQIVVQTHVASITIKSNIKRSDYNDILELEQVLEPVNLKCDFVVDKVSEKIKEPRSDVGIVAEVIRRASRELDVTIQAVMKKRLRDVQAEARAKAQRIKERGVATQPTSTTVEL